MSILNDLFGANHVVLGYGSIGKRHVKNLEFLGERNIATFDYDQKQSGAMYSCEYLKPPSEAVNGKPCYVCTPTFSHYEDMRHFIDNGAKAVFVEKPLFHHRFVNPPNSVYAPVVVGFQYRYHPVFRALKRNSPVDVLIMSAQDDLLSRYGATALETMASHSIDAALWVNGPAEGWETIDEGEYCSVRIEHSNGCLSQIRCNISKSPRISNISYRRAGYRFQTSVPANDQMYIDEMKAWLYFLDTGERGDLCFYEDAMKVQEIMRGSS